MTSWIATVVAFAALTAFPAQTAQPSSAEGRVPVLAELFTSEGCDKCPAADLLLEKLAREQPLPGTYVVLLSEHVTYWDQLGWKDSFGSSRFDRRQDMYAEHFGAENVFTPQLVVDGASQMVATDIAKLKSAFAEAVRTPKPALAVDVALDGANTVVATVSGPGLAAGEDGELFWAVTENGLEVEVTRGENAKRVLHHWGVVRTLTSRKIKPADVSKGMSETIRLDSQWKRANMQVVAFVQSAKTKRVLAIGWTGLPKS